MTYQEALEYLAQTEMMGSHLGLDRMRALLERLGSPERRLKFVHVAGTNGKGSTAALLDACLRQAGYRVGLYTSPHLVRYNERFRVDGKPISDEALASVTARVKAEADRLPESPAQFELLTCAAFCAFEEAGCDIVVLEVGLGGRLDATNVIPVPEVAVITHIGLEHTELLGDTLEAIAREKAGIVKSGGAVVLADPEKSVVRVTEEICRERGAALTLAPSAVPVSRSLAGQRFCWGSYGELTLSLLGAHQLQNAAAALTALEVLQKRGWQIPEAAVRRGLETAVWPGRFECVSIHPALLIDGGHNPQCAEAIAAALRDYFPGRKCRFLVGILADKDFRGIFDALLPLAGRIAAVTPASRRALPAEELCRRLEEVYGFSGAVPCESVGAALALLRQEAGPEDMICICGSLYMVGEVRELLGLDP